jgi:hypothetical protein
MPTSKFQTNKLKLIEHIITTNDREVIDYMNEIFEERNLKYQISENELQIVEESRTKYILGQDNWKTWNEVKTSLIDRRNEKF